MHSYDRRQVLVPTLSMKRGSGDRSTVKPSSSACRLLRMVRVLRLLAPGILTIPQDILAVQRLIKVDLVLVLGMPS